MSPRLYFKFLVRSSIRHQNFHSTVRTLDSHYDVLNLPQSASMADIKKRFYELSKKHHPDWNRNDPHACIRFVKISGAYNVLNNTILRKKYDQDIGVSPQTTCGSSRVFNPVGGRPASGLSRRKARFYGPSPSYFGSGDWSTFSNGKTERKTSGIHGGGLGAGGMGSGGKKDVPHFNWNGKYKQHENYERRKTAKVNNTRKSTEDPGFVIPVLAVSSILLITVWTATYTDPKKGKKS